MPFDPSSDYLYMDGSETVTFAPRSANNTFPISYTLTHALRIQSTAANLDAGSLLTRTSQSWYLWQNDLTTVGAPTPKIDDRLTDSLGVQWIVVAAHFTRLVNRWDLDCEKEVP